MQGLEAFRLPFRRSAWLRKSSFGESAPQDFPRHSWVRISAYLRLGRSDESFALHQFRLATGGCPRGICGGSFAAGLAKTTAASLNAGTRNRSARFMCNQLPDPTPALVMPPAGQESRPRLGADH